MLYRRTLQVQKQYKAHLLSSATPRSSESLAKEAARSDFIICPSNRQDKSAHLTGGNRVVCSPLLLLLSPYHPTTRIAKKLPAVPVAQSWPGQDALRLNKADSYHLPGRPSAKGSDRPPWTVSCRTARTQGSIHLRRHSPVWTLSCSRDPPDLNVPARFRLKVLLSLAALHGRSGNPEIKAGCAGLISRDYVGSWLLSYLRSHGRCLRYEPRWLCKAPPAAESLLSFEV